jgi:hypothetical protein
MCHLSMSLHTINQQDFGISEVQLANEMCSWPSSRPLYVEIVRPWRPEELETLTKEELIVLNS